MKWNNAYCHKTFNFDKKIKKHLTIKKKKKKLLNFVPWFSNDPRHRGERLSFDPPVNLENSMCTGDKSESCFSCSSIYTAHSCVELVHVNTCRCELIFILTYTGIPEPTG